MAATMMELVDHFPATIEEDNIKTVNKTRADGPFCSCEMARSHLLWSIGMEDRELNAIEAW